MIMSVDKLLILLAVILSGMRLSLVAQDHHEFTAQINQLNVSAQAYLKSYPDSTLILAQKALGLAQQASFSKGVASSTMGTKFLMN